MNKPQVENIGEREAAPVRQAKAGVTQLSNLPVAVNFTTQDLLHRDFTFVLTLEQAGLLLQSLQLACLNAVQMYGISDEPSQIIKPGGLNLTEGN